MKTLQHLSPTLFALAALAFVLPFATVSCEGAHTSFTGVQLATHSVPDGGRPDGGGFGESCTCRDISDEVEHDDSLLAEIALVAAVVGLGLGIAGIRRGAGLIALGGVICAVLMYVSRSFAAVELRIGYWVLLGAFGVAWILHVGYWLQRRRARQT
jgi:hypothetical protein